MRAPAITAALAVLCLSAGPGMAQDYRIPEMVLSDPPVAALISKGPADLEGQATVTGAAGAVEAGAFVSVACLDTAWVQMVPAGRMGRGGGWRRLKAES